jgi:hypothetical protein
MLAEVRTFSTGVAKGPRSRAIKGGIVLGRTAAALVKHVRNNKRRIIER